MDRDNDSRSSFVFPLIFFVRIAAAGGMLLITSSVVWLATVMGSLLRAMLIVSGACIVAAAAIYLIWLRRTIVCIRDRIETVYEVAHAARTGYDWLAGKFRLLGALLGVRQAYDVLKK